MRSLGFGNITLKALGEFQPRSLGFENITLKALANSSPGLLQPWVKKYPRRNSSQL
jgi:hypothetical protein